MVAAVTAVGCLAGGRLPASAADLLYLVPVIAAASRYGRAAGLVAAVAAAAAYNLFWTEPFGSLAVSDPGDLVTVATLLGVALATSGSAARARAQVDRAEAQAALASFASGIAAAPDSAALGRLWRRARAGCSGAMRWPSAPASRRSPPHPRRCWTR